jgi:transcriptional regulator with XRE-family HTH domain
MDATSKFPVNIRKARERHPEYKSLRAFARALGKSPSWVSKMERGIEKPSPETLLKIAQLLGLGQEILFQIAGMIEPDIEAFIHRHYAHVAGAIREMMEEIEG